MLPEEQKMADNNDAPRDFPITVTVDGRVRVTVVLTLKAGVEVAVKETKVEPTLDLRIRSAATSCAEVRGRSREPAALVAVTAHNHDHSIRSHAGKPDLRLLRKQTRPNYSQNVMSGCFSVEPGLSDRSEVPNTCLDAVCRP
jgi:hypothetical protein